MFGVMVLCIAACVREIPAVRHKVDLIEPLLGASLMRADVVERFALRGQLQPGDGIVFDGSPRGRPYRLSLNAAVAGDGMDAQVIWLCGRQRAPAGWTSPAAVVVEGLSLEQLPAVCRGAV